MLANVFTHFLGCNVLQPLLIVTVSKEMKVFDVMYVTMHRILSASRSGTQYTKPTRGRLSCSGLALTSRFRVSACVGNANYRQVCTKDLQLTSGQSLLSVHPNRVHGKQTVYPLWYDYICHR